MSHAQGACRPEPSALSPAGRGYTLLTADPDVAAHGPPGRFT